MFVAVMGVWEVTCASPLHSQGAVGLIFGVILGLPAASLQHSPTR